MEEPKEKVLMSLRKTRKAFLTEYGCGAAMLGLAGINALQGFPLSSTLMYPLLGVGGFSVFWAEFSRWMTRYKIKPSKIEIVKGIVMKHKKNVYFHPLGFVPDINTKQGRVQRLLGYGTIFVSGGGQENSFEIKDINRPHKVMGLIEELIQRNKKE